MLRARKTFTSSSSRRARDQGWSAASLLKAMPAASRWRCARSYIRLRISVLFSPVRMKPLASYSMDSRSDPLIATLGFGEGSRALMPCTVLSRASSTRRGRTWVATLRLMDTPVTS
ncbi:hypothetical protein D3C76_1498930 [compost metagenome]